MAEKTTFLKCLRGVIVSDSGWQRLQAAKQQAVFQNTTGQLDSLEEISQRTGLNYNTLIKVHRREIAVDRSTLETYFRSFGLMLEPSDYLRDVVHAGSMELTNLEEVNLQGPLPLNSPFYVKCLSIEPQCDEAILKPGALIRIKAPWQMGKTSLIARILNRGRETGLQTLLLSMRLADTSSFGNLDRLTF
ncbi:MAG: AAA-like domain-containing protein [Nostoc sp. DedQUE01]|nr:AAA-like domain-containing protein [Nostoc sp. DedQUE01]